MGKERGLSLIDVLLYSLCFGLGSFIVLGFMGLSKLGSTEIVSQKNKLIANNIWEDEDVVYGEIGSQYFVSVHRLNYKVDNDTKIVSRKFLCLIRDLETRGWILDTFSLRVCSSGEGPWIFGVCYKKEVVIKEVLGF